MVALASAPKLAPFNPSSADVIDKACELVAPGLGPRDVVFDLGCGDGRLLVRMAQCFRCRCVGVEYDEVFVERARAEVKRQGLEALVEIRHGDVCAVPPEELASCSVLFMYLSVQGNEQLQALVRSAYDAGAKVVSNMFSLKYLGEPKAMALCDGITRLMMYHKSDAPARAPAPPRELLDETASTLAKWEAMFDPLRNPRIMQLFNGSMAVLALLMPLLVWLGVDNIHVYVISTMTLLLAATVNWFVRELRGAVAAEAAAAAAPDKKTL